MTSFLQLLFSGLGMGCIYCLVAIEYTLIWNASGLVNFSHDKFIMLAAYFFGGTFALKLGLPVPIAIICALISMAIFGVVVATGVFNPLSKLDSNIYAVMGTIMLGQILQEAARLIWGPAPFTLPEFIKGSFRIAGAAIPRVHIVIMIVTIIVLISMDFMFKRTKLGKAMRCVAQDKKAASLMGINVSQNIATTVALSAVICGIIGILIIPVFNVSLSMSSMIGMKGFASGIVGGFGHIPGAILGGILIGVIESLYTGFGPAVYRDVVAFVFMILFLLVKPKGILGRSSNE